MNLFLRVLGWRPLPWTVAATLVALVLTWTLLATPRYRSTALLQLRDQDAASGMGAALSAVPGGSLLGLSKDGLETEMGVLRSRRVVDAVIDSLGLTVRRVSPAYGRDALVSVRLGQGLEPEGSIDFTREEAGSYALQADLTHGLASPVTAAAGDTVTIGNATLVLATTLRESGPPRFTLTFTPRFAVRRDVLSRLELMRPTQSAQLISATFDDPDPLLAQRVLQGVIDTYLSFTSGNVGGDALATASELRARLATLREELAVADDRVRKYQEQTGLVVPEEQAAAQVKRYAALRGEIDALTVEREALAKLLGTVRERSDAGKRTDAFRQLATFPSLISNRGIQDLLVTLTALENERSALRLARSDLNADVRRLTDRIAEVESQLGRLGAEYLESLDNQLAPLRAAVRAIDDELGALPAQQMQLVRLLREQRILGEELIALERQVRQTEMLEAVRRDGVRVVDQPLAPALDDPHFPKVGVHVLLALILGASAAGAILALRSALLRDSASPEASA